MTSRERARLILNHREADRPAIDLGSTIVTGTSAWTYGALRERLGITGNGVRVHEMFQMLAEPETPVLDAVGSDFVMVPKEVFILGYRYGQWKPFTFWNGQTFEVPADFDPVVTPEGHLEVPFEPGDERNMRLPSGGWFFDRIPEKSPDPLSVETIPESEWTFQESLPEELLRRQETRARELFEATERSLVAEAPLMTPLGHGNLYWWSMQMLTEPDYCYTYMMKQGEAAKKCFREFLQAVGDYVDVVTLNLADFGTQEREWFNPELFGRFYTPSWRITSDMVRAEFPRVKSFIHSCGSVAKLIPHFIDAGIDCLNPVQWTAAGMDLATLKGRYGDRMVFWGGAVSTQKTLPFGTPDDVEREVREVLDVLAPDGGFVGCAIHNVLPEVPVENTVALYRTLQSYRY